MTIQAVFFDMGGTIETFGYTQELRLNATHGIQSSLSAVGIDLGLSNQDLLELVTRGLKKYHLWSLETCVELSPEKVWKEFILPGYSFDCNALDEIAEELMVYIETHYYERKMRPEVPRVLETIQSMGLKIGLISNTNSRGQALLSLDLYGIRHYFDPIVLSSEYGFRKPDPSIFHYAARLMGVPTSACVYIGDRIARDIVGAQKAGFRLAVQIEHAFEHGEQDTGATPYAVITSLDELVVILHDELLRETKQPESPVRALIFDAGDILYHRPHLKDTIRAYLISLGLNPDVDRAEEIEALNSAAFSGQIGLDEYHDAFLRLYGVENPGDITRGIQIMREENNRIEFFDATADTLIALKKQGYLLGIITDTASSVQAKLSWLEQGGFGHIWDSIISSRELGVCKPDPLMYHTCLKQLNVPAEQAVFVGHSASELAGARAVGMQTVAFNRDEDAEADETIDKFSELLKLQILSYPEGNPN